MKKVLLVEDDKSTAKAISIFLKKKGYDVEIAYDLPTGIKIFTPDYPIVILDIVLGKEKSFPLLKKIKEESPTTAVIIITVYDDDENIKEAKRLGADAFVAKPFLIEHLETILFSKIKTLERK